MSAESGMRGRVILALAPLDACAVENSVDEGTPDVNCSAGWIELKQMPRWPAREATLVRFDERHFRPAQRAWLHRRCRMGGSAWLLLRVGADWVLLWGAWAARHLGSTTKAQLLEASVAHWPSGLNGQELMKCLLKHSTRSS